MEAYFDEVYLGESRLLVTLHLMYYVTKRRFIVLKLQSAPLPLVRASVGPPP